MAVGIGLLLALVLVPSFAHADDVRYTRQEARKDGSVWLYTVALVKERVHFTRERTKSPTGNYSMAAGKTDDWDLADPKSLARTLADLDRAPASKAKDTKAKEWVETCVEVKTKRCARRDAASKGSTEDAAIDKVRWELMNHTELDSI